MDGVDVDRNCNDVCATPSEGPYTSGCPNPDALLRFFDCIDALDCSAFPPYATELTDPVWNCIEQNCP
jgi:hypothetical protein